MKLEESFDFEIQDSYSGKKVSLRDDLSLEIPIRAKYLVVNPLEDEEEFLGNQGDSDRQQVIYYNIEGESIGVQNIDKAIRTDNLIFLLESKFKVLH